ncbi:hypothetical protein [Plantibacter sp. YIM 135249]|uniref:hypothetical protein n=1 Tax=Plantibacter sp. YIM 135249 TaxID=3423918 RepID=UPI003D334AAB
MSEMTGMDVGSTGGGEAAGSRPTASDDGVKAPRVRRFGADLLDALYPEGSRRDEESARVESQGTYLAVGAFALAAVIALVVFFGRWVPLWGTFSVGTLATIIGAVCGAASGVVGYLASGRTAAGAWRRQLPLVQRIADTVAITLLQVTILSMVMLAVFFSLQQAFRDLVVDTFTGVMITAVVAAVAAYAMYLSAVHLNAQRLSGLLAVFVLAGVMVSMVTSQDPEWWKLHFSELGAGVGLSRYSFNLTLIVAGFVMSTLGLYIVADLRRWERTAEPSPTRNVRVVQVAFVVIGLALAGIGVVPVNVSLLIHNTFATGMALAFVALLIGLRWILDGLPRAVFVFSDALLVGVGVAVVLWWPIGYYNLTALELIAASLIFTWLIVFIRNIGALVGDVEGADFGDVSGADSGSVSRSAAGSDAGCSGAAAGAPADRISGAVSGSVGGVGGVRVGGSGVGSTGSSGVPSS